VDKLPGLPPPHYIAQDFASEGIAQGVIKF
jgi:hypothetical protein